MKKTLLMLVVFYGGITLSAQSLLNSLKYEAPKKLITVKGNTANVREKPNLKAPIVEVNCWEDWDKPEKLHLKKGILYPVTDDLDGWYEVNVTYPSSYVFSYLETKGYVSKSVVLEQPWTESLDSLIAEKRKNPIDEDYFPYSYVDLYDYRDLPNGEYAIISTTYNPNYYILTTIYNEFYTLWLGKVVDNVFVFKYPVHWEFKCHGRADDVVYVENKGEVNIFYYAEKGSVIHENNRATGYITIFHFDNFGDDWIERLFKDAIEEERTGVMYYNAEWINKY